MSYAEDQMLMLSGIQHFMFCPRQWALIHIEQQWAENYLTTEGQILHERVDNPAYRQKNGETITIRAVQVASPSLGLYGVTDAVELHPAADDEAAITHNRYPGRWIPYPVEYKRGHAKPDERDEVQLAAQVICLEEMYHITLHEAALFYWETNRRVVVPMTDALRQLTRDCAQKMHSLYEQHKLPRAEWMPPCQRCSLVDVCMPQQQSSVVAYLKKNLYEETT